MTLQTVTISNLCIYTTDKGRFFFDMSKDDRYPERFDRSFAGSRHDQKYRAWNWFLTGWRFRQSTSEFVIIRYLDSGYFLHKDGTAHEDWQKTACDRTAGYGYDLKMLLQEWIRWWHIKRVCKARLSFLPGAVLRDRPKKWRFVSFFVSGRRRPKEEKAWRMRMMKWKD